LDCPKTAIKKFVGSLSTSLLYHISKESKNSFLGKTNRKNRKGFRTCAWRAALCAASRKINGRRSAPPTKWLSKNRKVRFWCIYTIPLEPILSKIRRNFLASAAAARKRGFRGKGIAAAVSAFRPPADFLKYMALLSHMLNLGLKFDKLLTFIL